MAVKFSLGGGDILQKSFTDTFARANASTWGRNWIRTLANTPGGGGNGSTGFAVVSGNQGVMTSINGAGATQFYQPTWVPLQVYLNLYSQSGVFVQCNFQANGAATFFDLYLRYNHDLQNGQTQSEGADYYGMTMSGRIDKRIGGAAETTIGAATWTVAAGDLVRFECLTVGATVVLQSIRNGAVLQTITDNAASAILTGGPGVGINSSAATNQNCILTNFSCGPLSVLST